MISRDEPLRTRAYAYCSEKGYRIAQATTYDEAMDTLPGLAELDALVIDIQGIPRSEHGTAFPQFSQWLARHCNGHGKPVILYLLRKGARRPNLRLEGIVLKKPFPLEALGEVLRQQLGYPTGDRSEAGFDLDLATNTLKNGPLDVHLTRIEATLLAYLMEHEGETMNPSDLLLRVWQYQNPEGANTLVRAHVSNLRKKLRAATGDDRVIQTVRGKGYRYIAA
jgi:DNA-binding response OmpR family regulator